MPAASNYRDLATLHDLAQRPTIEELKEGRKAIVTVRLYFFFRFFVYGIWSLLASKLRKLVYNLCLHFARQDAMATKVTKIPKTKRHKYGMNETKTKKRA